MLPAPADGGRRLPGRPLTLALGWLLSCVLITAVTLTAVQRVGREVSGSQGLITTLGGIRQQVAAQSASAASAASASSTSPTPSPSAQASVVPPSRPTQPAPTPSHTPTAKASVSPATSSPAVPIVTAPLSSPTPVVVKPPPGATEYIYVCRAGLAVGGAVVPVITPSPSPSPSASSSGSLAPSPSITPTQQCNAVTDSDPHATGLRDRNTAAHRIGLADHEQELHLRQARHAADDHRPDQHRVQRRLDRERQRDDLRQGLHADGALDQQSAGRRVLQQELIDSLGASALAW